MTTIRPANIDDIPVMVKLYEEVLKRPANPSYIQTSIENYPVFVAEHKEMLGFVYCRKFSPDILEVANILLLSESRGLGIGELLMKAVEEAATSYEAIILVNSSLYTEASDKRDPKNFYTKCGFNIILETNGSKVFAKHITKE